MKQNNLIIAFCMLLLCSLVMTNCTKAFKDVQINVNSDVFKYTASLDVDGSSGASMDDATVTLNGQDAGRIYNMDGFRDFRIDSGILTFGVDPSLSPIEDQPVEFNVIIQKTGYPAVNIPIEISVQNDSSFYAVTMIDRLHPPEGIESKENDLSLASGKVIRDTLLYVGPGTCTCTTVKTTIDLKKGTGFTDAAAQALGIETDGNGPDLSRLLISLLYVDASSNKALKFFPGGSLTQKKVRTAGGRFLAGNLLPAGLIELTMSIGGAEIKKFTLPVKVDIELNPAYINPLTGQKVKAGDLLQVFTYQSDNGYWQYEASGTVLTSGGQLFVSFQTDHLSWFMVGDFVEA